MYRKIILCFMAACCFLFTKASLAQSGCYSISSAAQTALEPSSSVSLSSLSVCHQYQFVYTITNGSLGTVNDDLTINLPDGISYASLGASSGASVVYASGTTSPVFTINGWAPGANVTFTILATTPSCTRIATTNSVTTISGSNSCNTYSVSASLPVVAPTLYAINNAGTGSLLVNVGDVKELVFKVQNVSGNGASISQIDVLCSPDPTITFLGNYYLSTSGTGVSGNAYTYAYPSPAPAAVSPTATIASNDIQLGASDFNYFFSATHFPALEILYVHIPYKVTHCVSTNPGGTYTVTTGCGLSSCSTTTLTSSIDILSGSPYMSVTNYLPFNTATYCTTNGQPTSGTLGFVYKNNGATISGAPAGNARATDLKFFMYSSTDFGTLDMSTLKITSGTYTLPIPSSVILSSTYGAFTTHTINLSLLPVLTPTTTPGVWSPLGPNSIADLDGDGFIDDIDETGTFTISAQFNYNTTACPNFSTCTYFGTPCSIMSRCNNECFSLPPSDGRQIPMTTGDPIDARYYYLASGSGATIVTPPDILEGPTFTMSVCNDAYQEVFSPPSYDLGCPNGYHQQYIELPAGYHLSPGSLTALSPAVTGVSGGVYQLPALTASAAVYCGGGTQLITPTVEEICAQGSVPAHILVKFGRIPSGNCSGYDNRTYTLPCFSVPMYLECVGTATVCPTIPLNFGADVISSKFQYICDASCASCAPKIACSATSAYHHCNGDCDSYFSTNQDFNFRRKNLGYNNTTPYYTCTTTPVPLSVSTDPPIDIHSAYPGDLIEANLSGVFNGTPHSAGTPTLTGASFDDVYMQIRYNNITPGLSASPDLFRLDQTQGSFTITNQSTLAYTVIPASDLTYTYINNLGVSHMNINISAGGRAFMNDPTVTYSLVADVYLIARNTPGAAGSVPTFYYEGYYPLLDLRSEFMGTQTVTSGTTTTEVIRNSCDSWGDHFTMLQPRAVADKYYWTGSSVSTCDTYTMGFSFGVYGGRYYQHKDDFPYEFRTYGALDPDVDIHLPPGYQYISSSFLLFDDLYSAADINGFGTFSQQTYPVSGEVATTSPSGTDIHYHGISGGTSCWPLLDLKFNSVFPIYYINVVMQPLCDAPANDHFEYSSGYTIGTNRYDPADPSLQLHTAFSFTNIPVQHVNPTVNLYPPTASVNAYSNLAEFDFTYCGPISLTASHPWMAFENSSTNSLDLTTATITALPAGVSVPYSTYTDGNGNQAILANVSALTPSMCRDYKITAYVNGNGCIPNQIDNMLVKFGNECSTVTITSPDASCQQGSVNFPFKRYPSDLELYPAISLPTNAIDLCNGIQTYSLIINSSDIGTVRNPAFWIHLPGGITVQNIRFDYTTGSPAFYTTTTADATTFGGGSDPGWNIYSHLPGLANGLPGGLVNNQIVVTVTLQTSCSYNGTDYVKFYAGGISSCSQNLVTVPVQHRPTINNATPADELSVQAAFSSSDLSPGLNCTNTGVVTVTITNNGSASNAHTDILNVVVPGAPLAVSNYSPAALMTNTLSWTIPPASIGSGASQTYSFAVSLSGSITCQSALTFTATINYNETVSCTSAGGSCSLSYSSTPVSFSVSACCNPCSLSVNLTPHPVSCYGMNDGTISSTPVNGTGPYTYAWSNGQTGSTLTGAGPGTYTLTLTDHNGCVATQTAVITEPSPVVVSISPATSTICAGTSTVLCASGAISYTWSPGQTAPCLTVTPSATTVYTVTASGEGGCTASASATVIVNALPGISITPVSSTLCVGSSTTLCASGATTYTWNTGQTGACNTFTPSVTTIYTVTGTNTSGCVGSTTATLYVVPVPTVSISPPTPTICLGTTTTFCPSGATSYTWASAGSYTWTPAGTYSCIAVSSATGATIYTVTGSNGFCNSAPATATLYVRPRPTICLNPSVTICRGACTRLSGVCETGKPSYTWTPPPSTGSPNDPIISVCPTVTTVYTLTASNAGGCINTATTVVYVTPGPTVSIAAVSPTICAGTSTVLCASGALSYTWGPGQTAPCLTVTPSVTTVYTVTGSNAEGCSSTATATVYVAPIPGVSVTPVSSTVCVGSSTTLCASGATTYTWNTGQTGACNTFTPSVTTIYTVTGTSANGCVGSFTAGIYVVPIPTVNISPSSATICLGATATLCPTGASSYTWASSGSYTWAPAGTYSCVAVSSATGATIYTLTGSNGFCSSAPSTATLYVRPNPTVCITRSLTICSGQCTNLSVGCATGKTSYTWSPAPPGGAASPTVITVCPTVTTVYTVTASNNAGCTTTTTTAVAITPLPTVSITPSFTTICAGQTVSLCGSGASTYSWTGISTNTCISVSPSSTRSYTLTGYGDLCSKTVVATVSVIPTPTLSISATSNTLCTGSSATLCVSGASSYTWNTTPVATTSCITVSPTVTTVYTVTGRNGSCNQVTANFTITVKPVPSLCSQHNTSICKGGTITVSGSCGGGPASGVNYSWLPTAGLSSPSSITSTASPTSSTMYTLTATDATTGCSSRVTASITVLPVPSLTVSPLTSTICNTETVVICASGASTYIWSTASTNTCIAVSPTVTTVYTVTGTSGSCNSKATSTVYVVPSNLSISGPVSVTCGSAHTYSMIPLISSPPTGYTWTATNSTAPPVNTGSSGSITFNYPGGVITWTASTTISVGHVCKTVKTLTVSCLPGTENPSSKQASNNHGHVSGTSAGIYPNPNNGNMVLEYHISSPGTLDIMDYDNHIIASYPLPADQERLEIHHTQLANGVYLYRVLAGQEIIRTDKIIIMR